MIFEVILFGVGFVLAIRLYSSTKNSNDNFLRLAEAGFFKDEDKQLSALAISKPIIQSRIHTKAETKSPFPPKSTKQTKLEGAKQYDTAYLFLGGFGDNPEIFKSVISFIGDQPNKSTFCFAPRTLGWGRSNFDEARKVRWQDWVLSALEALAVVTALADEVVLVAHSTGALTAAFCLQRIEPGQVSRCVFTGPNLACHPADEGIKKLGLHPIIGPLIQAIQPIVAKKLRNNRPVDVLNWKAHSSLWYLTALPLHTVREMWKMQEAMAQSSAPWVGVKDEITLVMGEEDLSVAPIETNAAFAKRFLPESVKLKSISLKNAAHGLFRETKDILEQVNDIIFRPAPSS
mmetsp:Transcript_20221/g.26721  ORF Transcript_20221/g.26721 Transcript_20221/m.26721 type:complete len:346 (+) Transcript_20221:221-1258(+)|eukprot:CAMPEP_0117752516 /NCGR_PEP_ID=MMETSP0947-20121206/11652_1 /TAXON_ID=44440 /ORGANISM="Chattonella subsalsa, Strain CCMP2191" /LENGTH=345 /DNA_ID=CAMNT_0005571173 /DNA_START=172 /DNA_END=1212 /DNA_ORIENTATION=-